MGSASTDPAPAGEPPEALTWTLLRRMTSLMSSGSALDDPNDVEKAKAFQKLRKDAYENLLASGKDDQIPIGYPSLAAYISEDIDGRAYRRFSYVRNGLLLRYQARVAKLEADLVALDRADEAQYAEKNLHAISRLQSWRYNENPARASERKAIFDELEAALAKYDELLLREHQIMSIQPCPPKMHRALFDFVLNGKHVPGVGSTKKKHLPDAEYAYLGPIDDFLLLGMQEDAWLSTYSRWIEPTMPRFLRKWLLVEKEQRSKNQTDPVRVFYSNSRTVRLVKLIVVLAATSLLAVPIIILYVLTICDQSGWLRIGVLLVFTMIFSFLLAALTNARRNEMFGASAAYCAVLIVFLTFGQP